MASSRMPNGTENFPNCWASIATSWLELFIVQNRNDPTSESHIEGSGHFFGGFINTGNRKMWVVGSDLLPLGLSPKSSRVRTSIRYDHLHHPLNESTNCLEFDDSLRRISWRRDVCDILQAAAPADPACTFPLPFYRRAWKTHFWIHRA